MTPTPDGTVIGEAGSVSNVTSTGVTVALNHSYTNPVVIAQPGSYNDSDVALARVSDVTSSSFTVRMVEPAGGEHGGETVYYMVIESGSWELADGTHIEAGTVDTNKTIGKNISSSWKTIYYPNAFTDSAVVISQVQSSNGQDYVDTRMKSVWDTMFRVAMEEEEAATTVHATETIGWVAFDAASGTWNGRAYEIAFSEWSFTHVWETLDFTNTYTNPIFIGMETMNEGADPIHIRHANLDGDSIDLMVEEDQTADSEMDASWQAVSYLVIDGPCDLTGSVYGAETPTPTVTETSTPTATTLATATVTETATETPVPGNTSTATTTATDLPTETPEPGETSTATATATDEATATSEATVTPTPTTEGTEAGALNDGRSAYKLARPMMDDPSTETPTLTPESSQTPEATETETQTPESSPTVTMTSDTTATATQTPDGSPTVSLTPTATETAAAGSSGPITIDYTYDALNRLTSAIYSNGMEFHYSYDAADNVLAYTRVVDGISTVATYTYDDANQLLTATEGETTWYYTYDSNGNQVMSSPSQGEANGATRNTYNTAGYLVKVEEHNGTAWQVQSEMRYDGLGNRLEMTSYNEGVGETIRYQLDNGQPLAAVGTESTSFYLYGRGVIGTKTDTWGYVLQDGLGSTRQLATHEGVIAMSVAYTPWGDVLAYYGSGGIDFGYLGGVYDENTGLIYLGSGQYYDPVTGRRLTRGAGQSNPYKPGAYDPAGMMVAPLALIGFALGKKKKRGKWDTFIALLVVSVVLGMSVSACTQQTKESSSGSPAPTPTRTFTSAEIATIDAILAEKTEIAVTAEPIGSPTEAIVKNKCDVFEITDKIAKNTTNTIQALLDYINTDGKAISKLSEHFFIEENVRKYLKRLMVEAGLQKLNTNHLAYIYATTHLESGWGDFEELYTGEPTEEAKQRYFEDKYGRDTYVGRYILGNTETLDGYTFLGRGFIHLTGRGNYQAMSDLLGRPELMEADGFILAACSHTGCAKEYDYDFITKIAVVGMKYGKFTTVGLLAEKLNGANGEFDFRSAREIIGWSEDGSDIKAANLAKGYAKILSEHCVLGQVSEGLTCVPCP